MSSLTGHRLHLVPSAVTPLRFSDLRAGLTAHRRSTGLEQFKHTIASSLEADSVATYTSFRRAIYSCLRTLRTGTDDDRTGVLIPAYSCPDFYSAIDRAGLHVQCCDLDPRTLAIDVDSATDAAGPNTLAMIAVNHLGFANRMDRITEFCRDNRIFLIEDLGYSLEASFDGQRLGTFGDCSVLNFREGKAIPVGGGMVTTNHESLRVSDAGRHQTEPNPAILAGYKAFAHPALYGIYYTISNWLRRSGVLENRVSAHTEAEKGIEYSPPFSTMCDFQGAIGRRVYARIDEHRRQRADTARYYARELSDCDAIQTTRPLPSVSNAQFIRYPVLVDGSVSRSTVRSELLEAGIQTTALYEALDIDTEGCPNSERVRRSIVTLPTHPYVTRADRHRVIDAITTAVS